MKLDSEATMILLIALGFLIPINLSALYFFGFRPSDGTCVSACLMSILLVFSGIFFRDS